jgi:hypothetical protein
MNNLEQQSHYYRFGPLERRGLILGLRPGQVVVLGMGGLMCVLVLRSLSELPAALLTLISITAAVAVAFWPVEGRTLESWLPLVVAYGWRRLHGRHRFTSEAHLQGHLVSVRKDGEVAEVLPPKTRPASVQGLTILEARSLTDEDISVGVVKDVRRRTYTAALEARGRSFNLLDEEEQARAVEAWASILASYGRESSGISRLQWIERTVPDDGQAIAQHYEWRGDQDAPEGARRIYEQAISTARPSGLEHECLLVLQVDARRSWQRLRSGGRKDIDRRACALLLRELESLSQSLDGAGIVAEAPLTPRQLAQVIRTGYQPEIKPRLKLVNPEGPEVQNAWPQSTQESLLTYQAGERSFHATFHVREWPRVEVPPNFLSPLLLQSKATRALSMTLEPIPAMQAARELRRALVADASDEHLKEKAGWIASFRSLRETENVQRAEQELTDGQTAYRFSAYVTVSATSSEELEEACQEAEQAASQSHLELQRLTAEQEVGFTYTLPLCRGLR